MLQIQGFQFKGWLLFNGIKPISNDKSKKMWASYLHMEKSPSFDFVLHTWNMNEPETVSSGAQQGLSVLQ